MKNKQAKAQIIKTEMQVRNGCLPSVYEFKFHNGDFGCWVLLRSGWFFPWNLSRSYFPNRRPIERQVICTT